MRKIIRVVGFLIIFSPSVFAQNNCQAVNPHDSVVLGEVIVTGSRPAVNLNSLPASVSVISSKQIEGRFEQSLLPVLTEEVPGLFITSRGIMGYGVSTGAAGGMSIRGIGGNPTAQVLVLIDGHPQYMGLMGHPLPDAYQALMAERVEVVRGPASVLYGSNAMGGVINIITKKQPRDGIYTCLRNMYGSYNTLSTELDNAVRSGKFSSYASVSYNSSDGHRADMAFKQYSGYGKIGYNFTSSWNTFIDLNLTNFKASNPGPIQHPVIDNDADITRGATSFSLENNYEKSSGALKLYYNFGMHKINDGYSPGGSPLDTRFRSTDKMLGLTLYQSYSFSKGNQTTAGIDFQHFGGHSWNTSISVQPDQEIVRKSINEVAGYLNLQQALTEKLRINLGIRLDHHSVTGNAWIPQAGLSYIAARNTILKGIVSKGFRNPTIREMYMFPPQNPELEPENLMNYEVSVSQKLLNHTLAFDANLYYIKGDNSIQIQIADGKPKYMNTGQIENYGLEFSTQYKLNPYIGLSANYSWLHMKYKVLASPEHKLYVGINYTRNKWNLSTGVQYVNNLYTVLENKNTNTEGQTEHFTLWNLRASYKPVKLLEVFVKGENLLAQQYEISAGYPMPRATASGGINLRF